ncbi:MAG: hypothetical protein ACREAA_20155 [Candidatus Polarisedimenticolia bacterium]
MQIKERIDNCLTSLEQRRQSVDRFQTKVRHLMDSLKAGGMASGGLDEVLQTLQSVLTDYAEISSSCEDMVVALREIGDHLTRIEEGRQKILNGVETILKNLSHLDKVSAGGLQSGAPGAAGRPKKILLVRINPDAPTGPTAPKAEEEEGAETPTEETVH